MSTWQPIETAPKNIDVLVLHGRRVFVARYVSSKTLRGFLCSADGLAEYDVIDDDYYCPAGWYQHNYCKHCDSNYAGLYMNPTHWMPLPKSPAE